MSGPKVVRIVTREELISICEGHLARVEAALKAWIRTSRRNDCVSEQEIADAQARIARLRSLLVAGRFADLQKQGPQEIAFLQADLQERLAKVAEAAATAKSAERRRADAAKALLAALRQKGMAIPAGLQARLSAHGGSEDAQALAEAFALLAPAPNDSFEAQRVLAQRLKENEGSRSFSDWAAAQAPAPDDPAIARLERHIADLKLVAGAPAAAPFEARLTAAENDRSARRGLLLDSLALDLSAELTRAKARARSEGQLELILAELRQIDGAAAGDIERKTHDTPDLDELAKAAQIRLDAHRASLAADARRAAVLKALSRLGYEVSEGLATAWADQGRIVLRKPAQTGYGVELAGDPAASRMQMRVVAFEGEAATDPARDKDAETLWCGDVSTLERDLAAAGGGLIIERATPVGATPVKRVAAPSDASTPTAASTPRSRTRTLK